MKKCYIEEIERLYNEIDDVETFITSYQNEMELETPTIWMNQHEWSGYKDEALAILEAEISDCTQVIVDIYSRFIFENNLFEKRKESKFCKGGNG